MSSRTYPLMGYGPVVRGSRAVYLAMNLLEAYQETVKAERDGRPPPTEWTYQNETGRRMLGLEPMDLYRKAETMTRPPGLVKCPRCRGKGCQICRWAGETSRRHLGRFTPEQLKYDPDIAQPIPIKQGRD